ncbi:hypothetical protein V7149_13885 [Bacillus sp. JJ1503]|uniref:hypothetical protein n=1 Tax=unclassified Bacillus (in: firmicutes) TaxID=185979 RepID=UPI002FFE92FC
MGENPSFICLILVFFHWILRIIITGNIKVELPEDAKDFDPYGITYLLTLLLITVF